MRERWSKLISIVSTSNRFSLQKLSPQFSSYFKKSREPSPAYAWLKCKREEEKDCSALLNGAGIISRSGTIFEADSRYTRLSLIKTRDDIDLLVEALGSSYFWCDFLKHWVYFS
ncbi:unnamed protein product [Musa acuminata subsp. malaccensis]|uniref:(wild Malaysian banana) hypothetical protein n=1 Tax=Musa acuminata subsp. malaccensis TaxID=214687 RepID=A0A804HM67_MUSAM|nr:unnamed protein product [Musa acuminata subsp. malaccensis]